MPKILLPPKVKCWRCTNGKICIVVGEVPPGPDIPEKMAGKPLYDFEPCDCSAGERYWFDDLAVAVREAGFLPFTRGVKYSNDYIAAIVSVGGGPLKVERVESEEAGPNPTTALLSAITKYNENG